MLIDNILQQCNWNFLHLLHVLQHNTHKIEKISNLTAIHFTILH